jgi:hypothetical protein
VDDTPGRCNGNCDCTIYERNSDPMNCQIACSMDETCLGFEFRSNAAMICKFCTSECTGTRNSNDQYGCYNKPISKYYFGSKGGNFLLGCKRSVNASPPLA